MLPQAILLIEDESDRKCAEKLYVEHRYAMYVVTYSILHNVSDAQDAIAQMMLDILPRIYDIKTLERCKLRAHIISTVKNAALAMLARRKRERQLPYDDDGTDYTESASVEDANLRHNGCGRACADAGPTARARAPGALYEVLGRVDGRRDSSCAERKASQRASDTQPRAAACAGDTGKRGNMQ